MKKTHAKKLLTLAAAICISFTSATAFAPQTSIEAHAVGNLSNPTPIAPNSDYSAWNRIQRRDTHCYKVVLPTDGVFSVSLMVQDSESMDFKISNTQSFDEVLASGSVLNYDYISVKSGSVSAVLSAGTYYISTRSEFGKDYAQYQIKTAFESFGFTETPDSYDSPKSLSIGGSYTDALTKTDKEDWYKVTVPENGKYTFKYSSFQDTVQFKLKNIDLKEIAGKDCNLYNRINTEDVFLEAGTYYLHVYGWPSKYSFSMNIAKVKNVAISKVKAVSKKKVHVIFKNISDAEGYQIRYSTDKNFNKNVKTKTFTLNKTGYTKGGKRVFTISKLKRHKKYYFQIRTYVEKNNVRYYSGWSKAKKTKIK